MTIARPTTKDSVQAKKISQILAKATEKELSPTLHVLQEKIKLPKPVLYLLIEILDEVAKGNAVNLTPVHAELTTQEAADILHVSRPYLVKLLEQGKMPFHKVGTWRRVLYQDVMNYKQKITEERLKVLGKLTSQAQDMDMGY